MALANQDFLKNLLPSDHWKTFIDDVASIVLGVLPAGSVSATELAADAVETAKILNANVTAAKLASNAVETAKILDANVTLAKLASGIAPSHVAKYAGSITWSGSGATLATTVTGVAATDIVIASIQTKPTEAAYLAAVTPTLNTITLELSAANTSNNAVIQYAVFRAAA